MRVLGHAGRSLFGVGLAAALAGEARAGPVVMYSAPIWAERPSLEEIAAAYPLGASGGGVVNLECVVGRSGSLSSCQAVQEAPEGAGFGQAALTLASRFRVRPQDVPPADQPVAPRIAFSVMIGRAGETNWPCLPPSCVRHHGRPVAPSR